MDDATRLEWRLPFRARITGQATVGGVRRYTWVEQTFATSDGDTQDADPARAGDATSDWAVELNNADVPADTIVWLRFRGIVDEVPCYEFSQGTPGPAGGGVTVEEVDGAPTGAATTLKANQATGLRVTSVAAGVATLHNDFADLTVPGVVSVGAQTFRGPKFVADSDTTLLGSTVTTTVGQVALPYVDRGGVASGYLQVRAEHPSTSSDRNCRLSAAALILGLTTTSDTTGPGLYTSGSDIHLTPDSAFANAAGLNVANSGNDVTATLAAGSSIANATYRVNAFGVTHAGGGFSGVPIGGLNMVSGLYISGYPVRTASVPASAGASGAAGDVAADASFLYVCTSTNVWKRVAIAAW